MRSVSSSKVGDGRITSRIRRLAVLRDCISVKSNLM